MLKFAFLGLWECVPDESISHYFDQSKLKNLEQEKIKTRLGTIAWCSNAEMKLLKAKLKRNRTHR